MLQALAPHLRLPPDFGTDRVRRPRRAFRILSSWMRWPVGCVLIDAESRGP
jgi:hypothetical protein